MDASLTAVLINLGTGGIVVVLMILGYLAPKPAFQRILDENDKLKEALALERQRSDDATQSSVVTNQLIGALASLAAERRDADTREEHAEARNARAAEATGSGAGPQEARQVLNFTAEDNGL